MAMGRPRAFDTDKALDAAILVFWRNGYEGATIAQLTEAMGINPPSLYAAFGSKEKLLQAATDRYMQKRDMFLKEALDAPTAREVAERLLFGTADVYTDPENPPGCLLVQCGLACGEDSQSVQTELATKRSEVEEQLRERFLRARKEGNLSADADAQALSQYVSAVITGMGVMASSGATRENLHQIARVSLEAFGKQSGEHLSAPSTKRDGAGRH